MTVAYASLGQVEATVAGTTYPLDTVPGGHSHVTSTLAICNTSASTASVHVIHRIANAALSGNKQYLLQSYPVAPGSVFLTLGLTLAATDVLYVVSSVAGVAFNLYGADNS